MAKAFIRRVKNVGVVPIDYLILSDCLRLLKQKMKEEKYPDRKEHLNQIRKDIAEVLKRQMARKAA